MRRRYNFGWRRQTETGNSDSLITKPKKLPTKKRSTFKSETSKGICFLCICVCLCNFGRGNARGFNN